MARIREYTNRESIDTGPLVNAARGAQISGEVIGQSIKQGIGAVQQGIGEVEKHVAQSETSKLMADFATAQAELTTQWRDTAAKADPNDHDVADRFMQEVVAPRLEKMGEGLDTEQGQAMYARAAAGLHADLFQKTAADQSSLAGVAAITNLDTVTNQLSTTVRNDPAGFKSAIAMSNLTIEGLVQNEQLPRDKALELGQKIRAQIAQSAFIGMADQNPDAAKAALANGDFNDYIDGTIAKTLDSYADQRKNAQNADQRAADAALRKQQKDQADAVSSAISASMIDPKTGAVTVPSDYFTNLTKYAQLPPVCVTRPPFSTI